MASSVEGSPQILTISIKAIILDVCTPKINNDAFMNVYNRSTSGRLWCIPSICTLPTQFRSPFHLSRTPALNPKFYWSVLFCYACGRVWFSEEDSQQLPLQQRLWQRQQWHDLQEHFGNRLRQQHYFDTTTLTTIEPVSRIPYGTEESDNRWSPSEFSFVSLFPVKQNASFDYSFARSCFEGVKKLH